jgi:membrane fusion protein, multidrug efflux system
LDKLINNNKTDNPTLMKIPHCLSLLLMIFLQWGCSKKPNSSPKSPPAIEVVTKKVAGSDIRYYHDYPTVLNAMSEVDLRAQVNGYITGIYFVEGERVLKGQKLYSIDQQQYAASLQQASAYLKVQQSNLVRAEQDVKRYRALDKDGAIAKQQVDHAEAAYTAAVQQVEAAKGAVENLRTNVRYSTIVAPFDGTIGISNVRIGTAVSAGITLLNTISTDHPMAADITIDQKELISFSALFRDKASPDSTFRLSYSSKLYKSPGKISLIDRAVDPQTGTIKIRLTFPNADRTLRPGMNGTVQILSSPQQYVLIPYKSVTEQLGEFFVYVVGKDSLVTQRRISLGKQINKNVLVTEGLQDGDRIVIEGVQNLREGAQIAEAASPTK